jgi:hypothetical protein
MLGNNNRPAGQHQHTQQYFIRVTALIKANRFSLSWPGELGRYKSNGRETHLTSLSPQFPVEHRLQ